MLKFSEEHAVIKDMRIKGAASTPDGEKMTEADLTVQVDVSDRMWPALEDLFPGCGLVSKHCATLNEEEGAHGDTRSTKRDIGTVTLVIGYDDNLQIGRCPMVEDTLDYFDQEGASDYARKIREAIGQAE